MNDDRTTKIFLVIVLIAIVIWSVSVWNDPGGAWPAEQDIGDMYR